MNLWLKSLVPASKAFMVFPWTWCTVDPKSGTAKKEVLLAVTPVVVFTIQVLLFRVSGNTPGSRSPILKVHPGKRKYRTFGILDNIKFPSTSRTSVSLCNVLTAYLHLHSAIVSCYEVSLLFQHMLGTLMSDTQQFFFKCPVTHN